jgi:hypothetical protein
MAGLTTMTFPGVSADPSVGNMVAGLPTFTNPAWFCGTFALAMILETSITVNSGTPVLAISPG